MTLRPVLEVRQRYEHAVPVGRLTEHPDNPREGDEPAIAESMTTNGFYGAVYAQESNGWIVAGNHRHRVAVAKGASHIPVIWLDITDEQGRRILAVDQRTAQLGGINPERMARLLEHLAVTPDGLAGSGYTAGELEGMGVLLDPDAWDDMNATPRAEPPPPAGRDEDPPELAPRISLVVPPDLFEGWHALLSSYPGPNDTAKLTAHLRDQGLLE